MFLFQFWLTGFLISLPPTFQPPDSKPLVVVITEYDNTQAPLRVGVFERNGGFPKDNRGAKGYELKPSGHASATLTIRDIGYGEYVVAIFQDLNNNGKLDKSLVGFPKEPYCFSNNYNPRFRAPRFDDCRFSYSPTQTEVRVRMLNN
ncbi:MAG: DUF2141 domain-containing protein [Cytophagaceae bacterium]|nr:DUF2141 domain-containing protein [Cytophagaceae bacterium]